MNFRINFYLKMVQQKSFVKLKYLPRIFWKLQFDDFLCENLTCVKLLNCWFFFRDSLSAFDPSEFPSLGSRENNLAPNPALGTRSNYGKKS